MAYKQLCVAGQLLQLSRVSYGRADNSKNIHTLVFIVAAQMKSSIVRCVALIGLVDLPLTRSPLERLERLAAFWVFVVGATCN